MEHVGFHILLVEDNPGDIRLIREALIECGIPHRLTVSTDGAAALEYLLRTASRPGSPLPDLILLDLNLPKKDGREVLVKIKEDAILRRIPVVVLSSSEAEDDIRTAYESFANCYVSKPLDLEAFFGVVETIIRFWAETVVLPVRSVR